MRLLHVIGDHASSQMFMQRMGVQTYSLIIRSFASQTDSIPLPKNNPDGANVTVVIIILLSRSKPPS